MRSGASGRLPDPPAGQTGWPWEVDVAKAESPGEPLPTITLVTPSLNQGATLERTIRSVLAQGYPKLEYIIMDGGSTDETLDVIGRYEGHLTGWVSEVDDGQSDAINRGLAMGTGEVLGWLCGDDYLMPGALLDAGRRFAADPQCHWLAGAGDFVNRGSDRVDHHQSGLLDTWGLLDYWRYGMAGHYIPQPSCFWSRHLWELVGGVRESNHLAMDYELWLAFEEHAQLQTTEQVYSVSELHPGSKSVRAHGGQYAEIRRCALAAARRRGVSWGRLFWRKWSWAAAWRLRRLLTGKKP
jgi:glycosyltransferase involved in cell wall biosynthesis